MQIIKNRKIIRNQWRLDDGESASADDARNERVIVPLERYLAMQRAPGLPHIGVKLRADEEVEALAADLDKIPLIALEFGSFNEGRGYSQAVQLRKQYHYTGEIRALGAYPDNLPQMERCGIDAYQLAEGEDVEQALAAFGEITEYYRLSMGGV